MSFAVVMSMYQSSVTISGYSSPIFLQRLRNLPSVVLITFALVIIETRPLWFFRAYSYASLAILSQPSVVVTTKSSARSSVTLTPVRADGVCALGVLAEESPVDALFGNLDGAEVRKQIESLSHRNVCALDVRPRIARSAGWWSDP